MITFKNLSKDIPYVLFKDKYERAESANQQNVEAMCISSYSKTLEEVNARFVNLKFVEDRHFIFFSNYESPKSRDFESHTQITALFYWSSIDTQIRMKAKISKTSSEFSDEHFQGRTKEKNALAISSNQSQVIDSFDEVTKNFNETLEIMTSETLRPDFWGGYSFIPYYFEFWQGHENRLNKRHVFKLQDDQWKEQLLQP